MNRVIFTFLLTLISLSSAFSQSKKGDKDLDAAISKINAHANADIKIFKREVGIDFGIEEGKLDHIMVKYKMQPADVVFGLEVSKRCHKDVEEVAECYTKNKNKGWGQIAKEMGIKPGSQEFHEMKSCMKNSKYRGEDNQGDEDDDHDGNGKSKSKSNGHGNGHGKGKKK